MIEDRSGGGTPQELEGVVNGLIAQARKDPRLTTLFTTFRSSVPLIYANVDRARVKSQDVQVTDVFAALQIYLGSLYINDFNYLGRTYRVVAQADAPFRADRSQVAQLKTRNRAGAMVPLGSVMDLQDITGPDRINRYNLYESAEINGNNAPGSSSGEAIGIMETLAHENLPAADTNSNGPS